MVNSLASFSSLTLLLAISLGGDVARPAAAQLTRDCVGHAATTTPPVASLDAYRGNFAIGVPAGGAVVTFSVRNGELLMRPVLFDGAMVLSRVQGDSFVVVDYPSFGAAFRRDSVGCIVGAALRGVSPAGSYRRLSEFEQWPVMMLVAGRAREAAREWYYLDTLTAARQMVGAATQLLQSAERAPLVVTFLRETAALLPANPDVARALGDAMVFAGDRATAAREYQRAIQLNPNATDAALGLRLLGKGGLAADSGWHLPFALSAVFAPPTLREIASVSADWARRNLEPSDASVVHVYPIQLGGISAQAQLIRYRVEGSTRFGVIIVPDGATGALPILVEAKGVSPRFPPLFIPDGLTTPKILKADAGRVIYVVPGFRGERVVIGSDTVTSEGMRSDAWDGATDDLIALLRVAFRDVPQADSTHICVFGRSRGGGVALLAGIREPRVTCVVSWAAPTDWIQRMGQFGFSQEEFVNEGLRRRADPTQIGGQFIDFFLRGTIDGQETLETVRRRLIASSPLYFASRLPAVQMHWGLNDAIVPAVNGRDLVTAFRGGSKPAQCLQAYFHADAGHDQDRQLAPKQTRDFLARALFSPLPPHIRCR